MLAIPQVGAFTPADVAAITANFQQLLGIGTGRVIFLDTVNGNNSFSGLSSDKAVRTLAQAYAMANSGKNDTIALIGDGSTTATLRLEAAFTWAKNATHLIGVCAPSRISQRARIAPSSSTVAFANFFTISGNGCVFANLQWFDGFTTGTTSQIAHVVSGSRNVFYNCHIAGIADAEAAASAGSRCIKFSGGSENYYKDCTIGIDTVSRGAANANIEFASGCTRNIFDDCVFPIMASAATPLGIIVSGAAGSDRFQLFRRCMFINAVKSTATAMTALATLAASIGGMIVFKDCSIIGITGWGTDATSKAQMYLDGYVPSNASGIAVNPA